MQESFFTSRCFTNRIEPWNCFFQPFEDQASTDRERYRLQMENFQPSVESTEQPGSAESESSTKKQKTDPLFFEDLGKSK